MNGLSFLAAMIKAVDPSSVLASSDGPLASSALINASLADAAALCNGVNPFVLRAFTFALAFNRH